MNNVDLMISELISMTNRKKQLFDDIMQLTLEQKRDIEENKAENIQELINNKQEIIDIIDQEDEIFSKKFDSLKSAINVESIENADFTKYPALKELKLKVGAIMPYAKEIMAIEESNRDKLNVLLSGLKMEMKHISLGKKSIMAYERPTIYNDGIYIDQKK